MIFFISFQDINANPVFWVPISWGKVLGVLRPLPNRKRNNKRFLDMGLYLNVIIYYLRKIDLVYDGTGSMEYFTSYGTIA